MLYFMKMFFIFILYCRECLFSSSMKKHINILRNKLKMLCFNNSLCALYPSKKLFCLMVSFTQFQLETLWLRTDLISWSCLMVRKEFIQNIFFNSYIKTSFIRKITLLRRFTIREVLKYYWNFFSLRKTL